MEFKSHPGGLLLYVLIAHRVFPTQKHIYVCVLTLQTWVQSEVASVESTFCLFSKTHILGTAILGLLLREIQKTVSLIMIMSVVCEIVTEDVYWKGLDIHYEFISVFQLKSMDL